MKYKLKYMESNVFKSLKVPFNKIRSLLKDNPEFSGIECSMRIRGK